MPNFPTHAKFFHNLWDSYGLGGRSLSYQLVVHEHNGTHVDAPAHFLKNARADAYVTIERVPLAQLLGARCAHRLPGDESGRVCLEKAIERLGGRPRSNRGRGHRVIRFWLVGQLGAASKRRTTILKTGQGSASDAAEYLLSKKIAAIGVDTLSPDPPEALRTQPIHPIVLEKQVLIIENLCNLDQLPDFFLFLALPLKIREGSGSPIRAVGLV